MFILLDDWDVNDPMGIVNAHKKYESESSC